MKAALLCLALIACSNQARRDTLGATLGVLDTAESALHTYAPQHTEALIKAPGATSTIVMPEVAAFRAQVDKADADIAAGYRLVAAAGTLNDDQSLANAVAVGKAVLAELIALGALK